MREARTGRDGGNGGGGGLDTKGDSDEGGGEDCRRGGGGGGVRCGLYREGASWCHRFQRKQGCPQGHVSRSSGTGGQVASSGEYPSSLYVSSFQSFVLSSFLDISKVCSIEFRGRRRGKIQEVLSY